MLKLIAVATISVPLLFAGALVSSSWVVVDVRPADGSRIILPAPLFVARAALAFAPREAASVEVPEMVEYSDLAVRVLVALAEAPDGVLVEIDDADEHVLVAKQGDGLIVEVESDDEEVFISLPMSVAVEVLEGFDGERLELRQVLSAISKVSRTDLLHVRTQEEEVKVWIW